MKERTPMQQLDRKIAVYEKVAKTPRHARLLAKLQKIGPDTDKELHAHYKKTSQTLKRNRHVLERKYEQRKGT